MIFQEQYLIDWFMCNVEFPERFSIFLMPSVPLDKYRKDGSNQGRSNRCSPNQTNIGKESLSGIGLNNFC
jgi:hypothetical protein